MTTAYISVGSNVQPEANIRQGLAMLREEYGPLCLSPVYRSTAVGFEGDDFLNLVATFNSDDPVETVAETLDEIENRCGRIRNGIRFGPRTLDLDLILFGKQIIDQPGLKLPRDEILSYAFVLRPLADLDPQGIHPGEGKSYAALWTERSQGAQVLIPTPDINFNE
ncbi:MAG: 2-amino-4-hydroxy-6-hydroxymethyldihydropteridine diphosphokinase [Nevskiales bacterium]